jgi:membrane associated rhomboid family serine protease
MTQASVGFHCPECARQGKQKVYTARTLMRGGGQPFVTQALIAINVAVYFIGLSQSTNDALGGRTGFTSDGGLAAVFVADGDWWRVITSGFLHAGLIHLAFNMFALWILGSQMEAAIGRLRFAIVYFVSMLSGALAVLLVSPNSLTVGASGAIFGLFGLALAAQRSRGINIWQSGLGGVLLINLAFTFGVPGISIGGHLGGLAGGYLCGVLLYEVGPRLKVEAVPIVLCVVLGASCFTGALIAASAA